MGAKYDKVKKKWGKGQTKGRKCSSTLVLTAFTIMGKCNARVCMFE